VVLALIEAESAYDTKALWAARKALSSVLKEIALKKINEDNIVHMLLLTVLLTGIERLAAQYQISNLNLGIQATVMSILTCW
jgi:D-lactate dehydrogenase